MKKIGLLLFTLALLVSCTSDDLQGSSNPKSGENVHASFSLAVDGSGNVSSNVVSTRSSSAVDTTKVNDLWVIQFKYSTDKTGVVIGNPQYLTGVDPANVAVDLSPEASNIYFVANTANPDAFNISNCATEAGFCSLKKTFSTTTAMQNELTNTDAVLPMTGLLSNVTPEGVISTPVTMVRSVAGIKFVYTTNFASGSFTIAGIRLCYAPASMKYVEATETDFTTDAAADYFDYPLETITAANNQNGNFTFYMPENLKGTGADNTEPRNKSGILGKKCSYLEVKGKTGNGTDVLYKIYLGADDTKDYNVKRNTFYTVTADFQGVSLFDYRITTTNKNRREESNCYMVAPGDSIWIPVNRANTGWIAAGLAAPLTTTENAGWTCGIVWSDVTGVGTSTGSVVSVAKDATTPGYIKVKAGSVAGNTVVCVKDAAGTNILWSWHIWVTNYTPETRSNGTTGGYNGRTWMDRNLGATTSTVNTVSTLGLVYQWGRKDPFVNCTATSSGSTEKTIYSSGGTTTSVAKTVTPSAANILLSIQNPLKFYYLTTTPFDWYSTSAGNTDLWGGTSIVSTKTVFDPCPTGWRVPKFVGTVSPWDALATNGTFNTLTYGWDWSSNGLGFYSAAGMRGYYDGTFSNATYDIKTGIGGVYWSATPSGTSAYCLSFTSTATTTNDVKQRANGASVRCVKE